MSKKISSDWYHCDRCGVYNITVGPYLRKTGLYRYYCEKCQKIEKGEE